MHATGISDPGYRCKDFGAIATNRVKNAAGNNPVAQTKTKIYMYYKTLLAFLTALVVAATSSFAQDTHKSGPFQGAKANKGYVTHTTANGKSTLTLSDDFVPPQTPDPHWQVVDSNGKTYLLDRLMTKEQKVKKSIVVPDYVPDIAKVQMWCAFAETNLGEAAFEHPVK
jgi:hypothetical protein